MTNIYIYIYIYIYEIFIQNLNRIIFYKLKYIQWRKTLTQVQNKNKVHQEEQVYGSGITIICKIDIKIL